MSTKTNNRIKSSEIDEGTERLLSAIMDDERATQIVTWLARYYHRDHGFHTCTPLVDCDDHICKQAKQLIAKLKNSHIVEAT